MDIHDNAPSLAAGVEVRPLADVPPPHTDEQRRRLESGRALQGRQTRDGLINYTEAKRSLVFVPQFAVPHQPGTGWFNGIQVVTYFHQAQGPSSWMKYWVDHVDGLFVMGTRQSAPGANPWLEWTDRGRDYWESAQIGMANFQHDGVHFIPLDGNLNRPLYFWTQVWDGGTWLRHEDRLAVYTP
jgi:hypothetical protein